jgi:gamma-glutamylcyclotransferase (GGCT)/AIG2-like uncharacterized protein YtfP
LGEKQYRRSKEKMTKRLYVAYGSNLNLKQMARRCPTAKVYGIGKLKDYQLTFRNVATIEPDEGREVPVAVWELQPSDEQALDRYEGYPSFYRKEMVQVEMDGGETVTAMVYIMNSGVPSLPDSRYYNVIKEGYADVGLDEGHLALAVADTKQRMAN